MDGGKVPKGGVMARTRLFPREHGAWAVWIIPLIIGSISGGRISGQHALLFLASLFLFLAYVPVQILLRGSSDSHERHAARRWSIVTLSAGLLVGIVLIDQHTLILFPLGMLAAVFFLLNVMLTRNQPKSLWSDFTAIGGLTLTGPAARALSGGQTGFDEVLLWIFMVLFFGSSVFYVHMKMRAVAMKQSQWTFHDRLRVGVPNIVYHCAVLATVLFVVRTYELSLLIVMGFLPICLHALIGTLTMTSRVRFRRLGFMLVGQSLAFALIISSAPMP